ncbi:MAG: endonuclease [Candidatus Tagabacteria bacterium CG_4_10_14_0_2_um_filter_40_13]|uniref:Endonuclease n=1 Tax=Candidatus Berkelbacteria bacterium CG23_combo_of_CG06-09_8_20_14_all_41_73 TaxID=1974519 RepID=A0A2H0AZB7_9BACT|nr:MAG: endonuclease [Candidatus Berkelbacteria bacterium CG23_combo_of_CG06-09_8_20_14_all_41_73]PIQ69362.1 MAG: endonuclease [Candidatus Tagabacteria bacterium CG11_big_fil_rev_8_21_14_0_20_41_11]PIZ56336.1 MAG: endonuclease [Candidatus Tagabacteria bacterium CG_4_10_14_0_2_um_filter_40_13]
MAYVYILKSLKNKKYYIGSTEDLERRIKEHNNGQGGIFSKINGPWELVSFKKCRSIQEARLQEKKVKSYKSGEAFKKIINGEVAEWSKAARC